MSEYYTLFENCGSLDDEIQLGKYDGPVQPSHKHLQTRTYFPILLQHTSVSHENYCKQAFLDAMCKCIKSLKKQYSYMNLNVDNNGQIKANIDSSLSIKIGKKYYMCSTHGGGDSGQAMKKRTVKSLIDEKLRSSFMDRTVIKDLNGFKNELNLNGYRSVSSGVGYKIFLNNSNKIVDRLSVNAAIKEFTKHELQLLDQLRQTTDMALRFNGEFELQSILILNNASTYRSNLDIIRSDHTKLDLRLQINQSYEINFDSDSSPSAIRRLFKNFVQTPLGFPNLLQINILDPNEVKYIRRKEFIRYENKKVTRMFCFSAYSAHFVRHGIVKYNISEKDDFQVDVFPCIDIELTNNTEYSVLHRKDEDHCLFEPENQFDNYCRMSTNLVGFLARMDSDDETNNNNINDMYSEAFVYSLWDMALHLSDITTKWL